MKNLFFYCGLSFLALLLEGTVRHLPFLTIRIDFLWLLVLYLGFYVPLFPGGLLVLLIALLQEAVGAPVHGILILSYLLPFFILRGFYRQIYFEGPMAQILWVILMTLIQRGLHQAFLLWQGYEPTWIFLQEFAFGFLEAILTLYFFPLIEKGATIFERHETRLL